MRKKENNLHTHTHTHTHLANGILKSSNLVSGKVECFEVHHAQATLWEVAHVVILKIEHLGNGGTE